jgi:hypothetical protein
VLYNCNLLTLQISIDILSIFFNKQSFTLMLHFIYLHLIHLCCKLSVILISPVIPLLIVPSGYVIRGEVLTILINRNQTSDVKSPAKCHEWGKIGWPVHLYIKVKLCLLKNIDRMSIEICKVNKLQL